MTIRRGILLTAACMVVIAIGAGIIAWRRLSISSTAVSVDSALNQFKQDAKGSVAGPPRPGVYTYALSGKECAGVAGVHLCRDFPSRAQLILTRTPGTITMEMDVSQDHIETTRFRVHPDGLYMAWQRTKIVFGIAQDDSADTVPATLAVPAVLKVGLHWTQHFSTGGLPVTTLDKVTGQTTMTVGGTNLAVYEITADSKTGGAHPGTENDITWRSPSTGLDVRLVVHRRIGGVFPYTMDADATLLSVKPLG
jgi:hypothetical protein